MEAEQNNTWVIVFGGEKSFAFLPYVLKKEDRLGMICADSGANHAFESNLIPDIIIGDFDSIEHSVKEYFLQKGVEYLSYPQAKDYTDGELAIKEALKRGADNLYIFGAFGGRLDHQLANIFLAAGYIDLFKRIVFFGEDFLAFFGRPKEHLIIKGNIGDMVSLLPLSETVKKISLDGFHYPLQDDNLIFGTTWGISNQLKEEIGRIFYEEGILLVIHYLKKTRHIDLDYIKFI